MKGLLPTASRLKKRENPRTALWILCSSPVELIFGKKVANIDPGELGPFEDWLVAN
jgi:hypothetical protein